ncbi:hypothetical protein TRFO_40643 [Tritrichomonas foetus]|uniref:BEACH domain-containing protein n=1 Tax=Tritrichomonas foetus TaxID=1144522 RepID=A0A1J4J044_9EUKA|nr:hypothetical protein TRFO_40643 [Tritrichomonas foetus]|eukprot:OHS93030.1 hypothetical protein TRFO_40643 [Tritrichomonas foetus]
MTDDFDFSNIKDLFLLRLDESRFTIVPESLEGKCFLMFPKYEKNHFNLITKIKSRKDAKNILDDLGFNYHYSSEILQNIKKNPHTELTGTVVLFQTFSFLNHKINQLFQKQSNAPIHIQNQPKLQNEEKHIYLILCAIMYYIPKRSEYKQNLKYCNAFDFIFNLLHCYIQKNGYYKSQKIIERIIVIYQKAFWINLAYYNMFYEFLLKVKNKYDVTDQLLIMIQNMCSENHSFCQNQHFVYQISGVIHSECKNFNIEALKVLAIISNFTDKVSSETKKIVETLIDPIIIDLPSIFIEIPENTHNFSNYSGNLSFDSFDYNIIETQSKFTKGFKNIVSNNKDDVSFLLDKLDQSIRDKVVVLSEVLPIFPQELINLFFTIFRMKFESDIHENEKKYSFLIVFLILVQNISQNDLIFSFIDIFFHPLIFNQEQTIFNDISLNPIIDSLRSIVFSLTSSNKELIYTNLIPTTCNPLFLVEIVSRINDIQQYYELDFLKILCTNSLILQKIDIEHHSEQIENARSSLFLLLSRVFIETEGSFKYFEDVMRFCYEKSVSSQFIFIFAQCFSVYHNYIDFDEMYRFIHKSNENNLSIAWRFIEILVKDSLVHTSAVKNIFVILMEYLEKSPTYEALEYSLKYVSYFKEIKPEYLKTLTQCLKLHNSQELYTKLLYLLGRPPTMLPKQEAFVIKNPIFIPILIFTYGFNRQILRLFNVLTDHSLHSTLYFHKYQIDKVLFQLIHKGNVVNYRGITFNVAMENKSKCRILLHKIISLSSDYSMVSYYLTDKSNIKELNYFTANAINQPYPIIPYGIFDPTYKSEKLKPSMFHKYFSVSFWLRSDDNFLQSINETCKLVSFTGKENKISLCVCVRRSTLSVFYTDNKHKTDVVLSGNIANMSKWTLITIVFFNDKSRICTYMNDIQGNISEFVPVIFEDEQQSIICSIGGTLSKTKTHDICGYIGGVTFYDRAVSHNEIYERIYDFCKPPTDYIISTYSLNKTSIKNNEQSYFMKVTMTFPFDSFFSTITNPLTVNKILTQLISEENEEVCYQYLSLLDKISFYSEIDLSLIYYFIQQPSRHNYNRLFDCVYSIFSHLMTETQSKWFNHILMNFDIWINYSNFNKILFVWSNSIVNKFPHFFKEKPYFSTFLGKITNSSYKDILMQKYWKQYIVFLQKIANISVSASGISSLFSMINDALTNFPRNSRYYYLDEPKQSLNKDISFNINKTSNILNLHANDFATIFSEKDEVSNYIENVPESINANSYQDSMENQNDYYENSTGIPQTMPLYYPNVSNIDVIFQQVNALVPDPSPINLSNNFNYSSYQQSPYSNISLPSYPTVDFPSSNLPSQPTLFYPTVNFDNNNIQSNSMENKFDEDNVSFLIDLLKIAQCVVKNQENLIFVLLGILQIKHPKIICECLFVLFEITPEENLTSMTASVLQKIDPSYFKDLIELLSSEIPSYPSLFPLICSMAVFSNPSYIDNAIPYLINIQIKSHYKNSRNSANNAKSDPWFFFPILLSFYLESTSKQVILNNVVLLCENNIVNMIQVLSLITYLSDYFEEFENNDTMAQFLKLLSCSNGNKEFFVELFIQSCYSLLFVSCRNDKKSIDRKFALNNIEDIKDFINIDFSHITAKFLLRLDPTNSIMMIERNNIAIELMKNVSDQKLDIPNHHKAQTIRKILAVSSLRLFDTQSFDDYKNICNLIEILSKEYKEQYTKNIRFLFESLKKCMCVSYSSNIEKIPDDSFNQSMLIRIKSNGILRQKSVVDRCYRQCILLSTLKVKSYEPIKSTISSQTSNSKLTLFHQGSNEYHKKNNISSNFNSNCVLIKNGNSINSVFELNETCIILMTNEKTISLDLKNIYGYKRNKQIIEFFTKDGKSYYIVFHDTESNKKLRKKMTQKKIISRKLSNKILYRYVKYWQERSITTFKFLMFVNIYAAHTLNSQLKNCKPYFPSFILFEKESNNTLKIAEYEKWNQETVEFVDNLMDEHIFDENINSLQNLKSDKLIEQFTKRNNVSAQFYYFFESISMNEKMFNFASDRFEFIYKIRKMLEQVTNIEDWIKQAFDLNFEIRPRLERKRFVIEKYDINIRQSNDSIKFAVSLNKFETSIFSFILCTRKGDVFYCNEKESNPILRCTDYLNDAQFFKLFDGFALYNQKYHSLIIVNSHKEHYVLNNVYYEYPLFSGSSKKFLYLKSPTIICITKECNLTESKIICQLPSPVHLMKVSFEFYVIAIISDDLKVRTMTLNNGELISEFEIDEPAEEMMITDSFGFIFISTKSFIYLFTINGSLIKKVENIFSDIVSWFSFTDKNGVDYIGNVNSNGEIYYFEAFYPLNMITIGKFRNVASIAFDVLSDKLMILQNTGKIIARSQPLSTIESYY